MEVISHLPRLRVVLWKLCEIQAHFGQSSKPISIADDLKAVFVGSSDQPDAHYVHSAARIVEGRRA
jgi:hypothetical protein